MITLMLAVTLSIQEVQALHVTIQECEFSSALDLRLQKVYPHYVYCCSDLTVTFFSILPMEHCKHGPVFSDDSR